MSSLELVQGIRWVSYACSVVLQFVDKRLVSDQHHLPAPVDHVGSTYNTGTLPHVFTMVLCYMHTCLRNALADVHSFALPCLMHRP